MGGREGALLVQRHAPGLAVSMHPLRRIVLRSHEHTECHAAARSPDRAACRPTGGEAQVKTSGEMSERLQNIMDAFTDMHTALENMPKPNGDAADTGVAYFVWYQAWAVPVLAKAEAILRAKETRQ